MIFSNTLIRIISSDWLLFLSIEVLIALGTATLIAFFSYNSPGMDFYPPNS
jgi:hypothetical protein